MEPRVPFSAPHKPGVMVHAYNPTIKEAEAGGSEIQGGPHLPDTVSQKKKKKNLDYMVPL